MPTTVSAPRRRGASLLLVDALSFVAALADHTSMHPSPARPSIQNLPAYHSLQWHLHGNDAPNLRQMLLAAWQAEAEVNSLSTDFVFPVEADAAAWLLKKARESIAHTQRAFLQIQGIPASLSPPLIRREVGRLVVKNTYPRWLSCYAAGAYNDYSVSRLPQFVGPVTPTLRRQKDTQSLLGLALMSHRNFVAHHTRELVQQNPNTAIRSSFDGRPIEHFHEEHWHQLTWRLGYTNVFDVLNHATLPRVVTPLQLHRFQQQLAHIVGIINDVHECYVRKILGPVEEAPLQEHIPEFAFLLPRWQ